MPCCHETDGMKSTPCAVQAQEPAPVLTCMLICWCLLYIYLLQKLCTSLDTFTFNIIIMYSHHHTFNFYQYIIFLFHPQRDQSYCTLR